MPATSDLLKYAVWTTLMASMLWTSSSLDARGNKREDLPDRWSAEVLIQRNNTLGGWEVYGRLQQEPASPEIWMRLRVHDLMNVKKRVKDIEQIELVVDGQSFHVTCETGEHVGRLARGIGIFGDDTTHHYCPLPEEILEPLAQAREIQSQLTIAGQGRKVRQWKPKALAKWAAFLR